MARYIVPAEMPKSCAHCQFSFWVKGRTSKKEYRCALTGLSVCLELNDFETKADWCPLVDAADVVTKSEVERLEREVAILNEKNAGLALACFCDCMANEDCLGHNEWKAIKAEVAREIFEEIEAEITAALKSNYEARKAYNPTDEFHMWVQGKIDALGGIEYFIAELKKKYTEVKDDKTDNHT